MAFLWAKLQLTWISLLVHTALYVSASSSPDCRLFNPIILQFYLLVNGLFWYLFLETTYSTGCKESLNNSAGDHRLFILTITSNKGLEQYSFYCILNLEKGEWGNTKKENDVTRPHFIFSEPPYKILSGLWICIALILIPRANVRLNCYPETKARE